AHRDLDLPDVLHPVFAHAQHRALGHRDRAALGHLRHAVDAVGRPPEELPLGRAPAALEDPGRHNLHRAARPGGAAGCLPRLLWRHTAAGVRDWKTAGVPAGAGAGKPAARVRRAGARMDQARRRRPARRQGRALPPLPIREMNTTPPIECKAWQDLAHHAESWRGRHLRSLFEQDVARASQLVAEAAGVRYDYSRQRIGAMTLRLLARLAAERGFAEWREALLAGKPVNNTENRPAWHTALRASN